MKKIVAVLVSAGLLLVIGGFIGYKLGVGTRPEWLVEYAAPQQEDVDQFVERCLESRSLLNMASMGSYENASKEERLDLVDVWCKGNVPESYQSLSDDQKAFAVRRLRTQLDSLLAERVFDPGNE